jgi:hypothetical protein
MKWVEVLNQAVAWSDFHTASQRVSPSGALKSADHARVVADAALLRRVFAASYLQIELASEDRQRLLQWLDSVTPSLNRRLSSGDLDCGLRGMRREAALPAPFELELTSALLQFLATVSEAALFASVHRCQGIRRGAILPLLPEALEVQFAEHASLRALLAGAASGQVLSQCSNLIFSARGRRFCSKGCSNANFAARKAQKEPQYFADKQERYRSRQRKAEETSSPASEGAFVYID